MKSPSLYIYKEKKIQIFESKKQTNRLKIFYYINLYCVYLYIKLYTLGHDVSTSYLPTPSICFWSKILFVLFYFPVLVHRVYKVDSTCKKTPILAYMNRFTDPTVRKPMLAYCTIDRRILTLLLGINSQSKTVDVEKEFSERSEFKVTRFCDSLSLSKVHVLSV